MERDTQRTEVTEALEQASFEERRPPTTTNASAYEESKASISKVELFEPKQQLSKVTNVQSINPHKSP